MTFEQYIKDEFGYEMKTTFWQDFTIADKFCIAAVKDTYRRSFKGWRSNYIYLTEFVMVLNWKCWYWYGKNNALSEVYKELFYEADEWAQDNLKDNELTYYYKTTD